MPGQTSPPIPPLEPGPRRPGLGIPLWLMVGLLLGFALGHPIWGAVLGVLAGAVHEAIVRR